MAGFDEGDKPADWVMGLERRGIRVMLDVERETCADVLRAYAQNGGPIYGPEGTVDSPPLGSMRWHTVASPYTPSN